MKISDKVIVITGGSKGLGAALTTIFANKNNKVVVISRSVNKKYFKSKKIFSMKVDVTQEKEVKTATSKIVKKYGHIDIWINNAGLWMSHAKIENIDQEKFHKLIEVNLFGTVYGSKQALIQMKKQKVGVIVNILSSSAIGSHPGSSGYCASKYAALGFTESLREEVRDFGISVISVYPKGMKTELFNEKKPGRYNNFMDSSYVARKIIKNLESKNIKEDIRIFK